MIQKSESAQFDVESAQKLPQKQHETKGFSDRGGKETTSQASGKDSEHNESSGGWEFFSGLIKAALIIGILWYFGFAKLILGQFGLGLYDKAEFRELVVGKTKPEIVAELGKPDNTGFMNGDNEFVYYNIVKNQSTGKAYSITRVYLNPALSLFTGGEITATAVSHM